jgi:acetyl-CoA C-acetyltransferase
MPEPVYVLGAGRTDFARNLRKEEKTLRDVIVEAGRLAIGSAGIQPSDVTSGVVGNFAAGRFTKQLHLGSFLTDVDDALRGIPTYHTEAACASGAVAFVAGAQQVMGGLADVVLVVGAEQQKTMAPGDVGDVLAGAGDYGEERPMYGDFMFPSLFGKIAQLYQDAHGLTPEQISSIAYKNRLHAKLNPLAQMRTKALERDAACTVSDGNPMIAEPLIKASDCSQITDGAAAVILCSESFMNTVGRKAPRLLGLGHKTDHLPLRQKDAPTFSVAGSACKAALDQAGMTPADLHGADVHDCFSISEIVAYELMGLCGPGEGKNVAERGDTMLEQCGGTGKHFPINPGGGLMGDGHPVGATGVRQLCEMFEQLGGSAGDRQIDGASKYLTFNMGGSFTTSVCAVWG